MKHDEKNACAQVNLEEDNKREDVVSCIEDQESHDSLGVLTDTQEPIQIRSIRLTTEDVPIKDIQYLRGFMYSRYPTDLDRPHVARTPEGDFLLDGLDLKMESEENGDLSINSDVEIFDVHCEPDLCFRAAGSRMKPRGGHAAYMEKCHTVLFLLIMLLSTDENLKIFSHGGKRDNNGPSGNREDDARRILCKKFDNNRDTINSYLSHIAYLSVDAIEHFIEHDANKSFFDEVRKEKTNLVNKLKGENAGDEAITQQVSAFMLLTYEEYTKARQNGKKKGKESIRQQTESSPNAEKPLEATETTGNTEDADYNSSEPNENPESEQVDNENDNEEASGDEDSPSVPQIKQEVIGVSQRLSEKVEHTESLDDLEKTIMEELGILMVTLTHIAHLKSKK